MLMLTVVLEEVLEVGLDLVEGTVVVVEESLSVFSELGVVVVLVSPGMVVVLVVVASMLGVEVMLRVVRDRGQLLVLVVTLLMVEEVLRVVAGERGQIVVLVVTEVLASESC